MFLVTKLSNRFCFVLGRLPSASEFWEMVEFLSVLSMMDCLLPREAIVSTASVSSLGVRASLLISILWVCVYWVGSLFIFSIEG